MNIQAMERAMCEIWSRAERDGDWFRAFEDLSGIAWILVNIDVRTVDHIAQDYSDMAMVAAQRMKMAQREQEFRELEAVAI